MPKQLGIDLTIPAPDWSNGLICSESALQHSASKFLGGEGIITLVTLGLGPLLQAGDVHHVATVRSPFTWTPKFRQIFDAAGISMEHAANKVRVARHFAPGGHPNLYHQLVYDELIGATAGRSGADMTARLLQKLEELARRCATPGDPLNYYITRP